MNLHPTAEASCCKAKRNQRISNVTACRVKCICLLSFQFSEIFHRIRTLVLKCAASFHTFVFVTNKKNVLLLRCFFGCRFWLCLVKCPVLPYSRHYDLVPQGGNIGQKSLVGFIVQAPADSKHRRPQINERELKVKAKIEKDQLVLHLFKHFLTIS